MAEQIGVLHIPGGRILREIVKQGLDHRRSLFMGLCHGFPDIALHGFSQADVIYHHLLHLRSIAPDLIVRAGRTDSATINGIRIHGRLMGIPVAVKAHDGAEGPILKPAHQKLMECGIVDISAVEAADVSRPPGNSGHPHVQSGHNLISQIGEGGRHVAGPDQRAVLLRSGPGTADQVDWIFHTRLFHAIVKGLRVTHRILVGAFQSGTVIVAVQVKIRRGVLRLRLVQPEQSNAFVKIIFLHRIPDKFPGFRIGGVHEFFHAEAFHGDGNAAVCPDQQVPLLHFLIVHGFAVNGGPDGYHQADSHLTKLPDHPFRVRKIFLIKGPVSLMGPVEEIQHDHA